ncbi:MAG TPA: penicillin acylase family protein [Longimicrobiales bacterium]|nr:penicillin acylase family protein [Longimicrobiales bacterium]
MKKMIFIAVLLMASQAMAQKPSAEELARWKRTAANVTITRDDWGIAHVHGKTDADAVFGTEYAQAEDDFNRVEMNYLNALGRTAEANGEVDVYDDLRMRLYFDVDSLKAFYRASPPWLQQLMNAFADGLNYFLYTHPQVKPKVITRFEPWMAMSFTEGSIGWDIEDVSPSDLARFYGKEKNPAFLQPKERSVLDPGGSNGMAVAPSNTKNGHSLLLINPHTSFFFRSETHLTSDEGLNAYGAITWGQFFVYQGFNQYAGWMHTSTGAHLIDQYAETIVRRGDAYFYRYGNEERPVKSRLVTIGYKTTTGTTAWKQFTIYSTHHGPIIREQNGKWIAVRMMQEPIKALIQSFNRTKVRNYSDMHKIFDLHANSSNNTIFADREGNIAYFHSNYIPRRDESFDWTKPVDGSNPATEWGALLSVEESPHVHNPANGWVYNTNNWPFSAAGANSPRRADYPKYVDEVGENERGIHAIRVLQDKKDFTMESLRAAAYDTYLTYFEPLIPALVNIYDEKPASDPLKTKLAEQVDMLRKWDLRWSETSIPTALGVFWGHELMFTAEAIRPAVLLQALAKATDTMVARYGTWKKPWGEINRFQRLTADIRHPFNDAAPSIPVGFPSARFGSLASFDGPTPAGQRNIYGVRGNSFVAVVEFGDSVRAIAVTAGGESGDPRSKHFNDQAERYSRGDLRTVYFYPNQLVGHVERVYKPGDVVK